MNLNYLINTLEDNPSNQVLRELIPDLLDYLRSILEPCYCCQKQTQYGCQSGCQCSRPAKHICQNCGHLDKEHHDEKCLGKWSGSDGSKICPCRDFLLPSNPGDD